MPALRLSKGPFDQTSRIDRSDASPDNGQEVVSKAIERTSQCVRF